MTTAEVEMFIALFSKGDDATALVKVLNSSPKSVSQEFLIRLANAWKLAKRDADRLGRMQAAQLATISPDGFDLAIAARDDTTEDGARIGARLREFYAAGSDLFETAVGIEARLETANMHFLEVNAVYLYSLDANSLRKASRRKTLVGLKTTAAQKNSPFRVAAIRAISELFPEEKLTDFEIGPLDSLGLESPEAIDSVFLVVMLHRWEDFRVLLSNLKARVRNVDAKGQFEGYKEKYSKLKSEDLDDASDCIRIGEAVGEEGEYLLESAHSNPELVNRLEIMELATAWITEGKQLIAEGRQRLALGEKRKAWTRDELEYQAIALYAESRLNVARVTKAIAMPSGVARTNAIKAAEEDVDRFPLADVDRLARSRVHSNFSEKDTRQMRMWVHFTKQLVAVALGRLGRYSDAMKRMPVDEDGDYDLGSSYELDEREILSRNDQAGDVLNDILSELRSERDGFRRAFKYNQETRELMRFMGDRYSGNKVGPFDSSRYVRRVCTLAITAIDIYQNTTGEKKYELRGMEQIGTLTIDVLKELMPFRKSAE